MLQQHAGWLVQRGSKRLDLTCGGDLYFLRAKMVNDEVLDCAPVMREGRGEEYGYVDDAPEDAGVDDNETETAVATEMRPPTEPSDVTRRYHELTHLPSQPWCEQCVRGRAPDPPNRRMGRRVREKTVIQTDLCFMQQLWSMRSHLRRTQRCEKCVGGDGSCCVREITGPATIGHTERWRAIDI